MQLADFLEPNQCLLRNYYMAVQTKIILSTDCACGVRFEFRKAQAGTTLNCHNCGLMIPIASLRKLNTDRGIEKQISVPPSFQFSVRILLFLFFPFAIIAWIADRMGLESFLTLVLIVGLPILGYAGFVFIIATLIHYLPKWRNALWDSLRGTPD